MQPLEAPPPPPPHAVGRYDLEVYPFLFVPLLGHAAAMVAVFKTGRMVLFCARSSADVVRAFERIYEPVVKNRLD